MSDIYEVKGEPLKFQLRNERDDFSYYTFRNEKYRYNLTFTIKEVFINPKFEMQYMGRVKVVNVCEPSFVCHGYYDDNNNFFSFKTNEERIGRIEKEYSSIFRTFATVHEIFLKYLKKRYDSIDILTLFMVQNDNTSIRHDIYLRLAENIANRFNLNIYETEEENIYIYTQEYEEDYIKKLIEKKLI